MDFGYNCKWSTWFSKYSQVHMVPVKDFRLKCQSSPRPPPKPVQGWCTTCQVTGDITTDQWSNISASGGFREGREGGGGRGGQVAAPPLPTSPLPPDLSVCMRCTRHSISCLHLTLFSSFIFMPKDNLPWRETSKVQTCKETCRLPPVSIGKCLLPVGKEEKAQLGKFRRRLRYLRTAECGR